MKNKWHTFDDEQRGGNDTRDIVCRYALVSSMVWLIKVHNRQIAAVK